LIDLGHRHIGLIGDVETRPKTTLRKLAGYQRALKSEGLPYAEACVQNVTEFGFDGGRRGFQNLIERCPNISGLFCINDAIALGAMDAARDLGRGCPADISIVGFGDSPEGSHWRPKLTTVALSANRVATTSLDLILERRKAPQQKPQTILIPEDLIVRESTGPAPTNKR
jgi:DNA-binding LacI/PurR family transcriptional regulator